MSQVNAATGDPAAALPSGTPPAAQPPAAATPAPAAGDVISIPRESLPEWAQNSWHKVAEAANQHQALGQMAELAQELVNAGYTQETARQMILDAQGPAGSPTPTPTPMPAQPPLTQAHLDAAIQRIGERFGTALDKRDVTNAERAQQQADRRTAQENEVKFRDETLKTMDYVLENEDGTPNVPGGLVRMAFNEALNKVLVDGEPEGLDEDARSMYYATPTKEHLEGAAKAIEHLKGLKYEMAAEVAQAQEQTPSATLGDGPAGPQAPKDLSEMTPEDKVAAITDGVDIERPDAAPGS